MADFPIDGYTKLPILHGKAVCTVDGTGEINLNIEPVFKED
ncbi:hypothetical protein [Clostridium psychrophilum]|nr:hypothetical protein [Clostridium psychrophilum]